MARSAYSTTRRGQTKICHFLAFKIVRGLEAECCYIGIRQDLRTDWYLGFFSLAPPLSFDIVKRQRFLRVVQVGQYRIPILPLASLMPFAGVGAEVNGQALAAAGDTSSCILPLLALNLGCVAYKFARLSGCQANARYSLRIDESFISGNLAVVVYLSTINL